MIYVNYKNAKNTKKLRQSVNKLEKYLKHNGISQRFFAKKIDTTHNNLNMLVKGKSSPSLRLAYEIEKNTGGLVTMYDWLPPESFEIKKDLKELEK